MKIAYVGTLPPHPGGSAISAVQLLAGFAARGHAVRALAPIAEQDLGAEDPVHATYAGIAVRRFGVPYVESPTVGPTDGPAKNAYREHERRCVREGLAALLEEDRPDLVMSGRENFAWDAPRMARERWIPSIVRVAGGLTLRILDGTVPEHQRRALVDCFNEADLLLAPAEHLVTGLRAHGVKRIRVILNAVDIERFAPAPRDAALAVELGIAASDIVIVFPANLHGRKRPLDLVNAAALALEKEPRLRFVVAGDGDLREEMAQACARNGIAPRFVFAGWRDYREMPRFLNLADAVVLASDGEGLARVSIETQACGRLLIASDIPPSSEVVRDGETGLLFPTTDVRALADVLLRAASSPELRERIGREARRNATLRHDHQHAVDAWLETLEEVIRESRRRPPANLSSGTR